MMELRVTDARSGESPRLTPSGALRTCEGATLHVAVTTPGESHVAVHLEGIPLRLLSASPAGAGLLCRTYELPVHTWAGRAMLFCESGSVKEGLALDVSPHPEKFGSTQLAEYLEELMLRALGLPFGFSPGGHDFALSDEGTRLLHPFVIDALLPQLLEALSRLRREALQSTVRERTMAPLTSARRVDAKTLRWLASHPVAYASVRPLSARQESGDARTPIEQSVVLSTYDHAANRYLVYLLHRLRRAFATTQRALEVYTARNQDDDVRARASFLLEKMERARVSLLRALNSGPLRGIEPRPPTAGAVQAVVDHPLYARIQRLARRLLHPGVGVTGEAELVAPLRHTFDLFELIALYRILSQLQALHPDWTWSTEPLVTRGVLLNPPSGTVAFGRGPDGRTLELAFQKTFRSVHETGPGAFRSISAQRRPDFIVVARQHGKLERWLALDAKFRTSRGAVHDGLADMHVYRDALRVEGEPAWGGWIIIPAVTDACAKFGRGSYHDENRFGALDASETSLSALLTRFLELGAPASAGDAWPDDVFEWLDPKWVPLARGLMELGVPEPTYIESELKVDGLTTEHLCVMSWVRGDEELALVEHMDASIHCDAEVLRARPRDETRSIASGLLSWFQKTCRPT